MKATDLMLGDWVLVDGETLKIGALPGIFENGYLRYLHVIEPIPITPEILEKNGFKFDGSGQRSMMLMTPWGEQGIRYSVYVGLKKKTIEVFAAHPAIRENDWRKCNKVYLEVCGCYVHELQHALRACKIDLEIKL